MKRYLVLAGWFVFLGWLDSLLAYLFPLDFQFQSFSILWHGLLVFGICISRFQNWKERLLTALMAGLILDLLFAGTFPVNTLLTVPVFLASSLSTNARLRKPVQLLIVFLLCLVYDALPVLLQGFMGIFTAGPFQWLFLMEIPSLIALVPTLWVLEGPAERYLKAEGIGTSRLL